MAKIKGATTGQELEVDTVSKAARVTSYNSDGSYSGEKATYRASTIIPLVAAITVNVPFFNIIGSASKTVTIKRIAISGATLTAVGYFAVNVVRLSSPSSGGTSTTLANVPMDTNDPSATAVVKAYTVAPTSGALVGTIATCRTLWQSTTAVGTSIPRDYVFDFDDMPETKGIRLRGTSQEMALLFPVVLASAGTLAVDIEWTEE